jgi:hypothetical protein
MSESRKISNECVSGVSPQVKENPSLPFEQSRTLQFKARLLWLQQTTGGSHGQYLHIRRHDPRILAEWKAVVK